MMLHWLQQTGNKPIALMGGGTTRVGDPSGRDETRKLLTYEQIDANKESIKGTFAKFMTFGAGKSDAVMADNAEWLTTLNYIEMLRDVGRHFSINRMLTMDSVKLRLERDQELSFIEFNYMILQSYDFIELARRYGCNLQMGGSDQWGNIVNGIDLGRRMGTHQLYALTCPLLTTASGAKMGKTAAGAVWLNADMLPVYDYWQVLAQHRGRRRRALPQAVHDAAADRDRPARGAAGPGDQRGQEGARHRGDRAAAWPRGGRTGRRRPRARRSRKARSPRDLPTVEVARADLEAGLGVLSAFAEKSGLVASNGEARRQIKGGGLKVNDATVTDEKMMLTAKDLTPEGVIKLSLGRKKHVLLKPV